MSERAASNASSGSSVPSDSSRSPESSHTIEIGRAPGPLRGRVRVPGSKSLSTRAIVLAALAREPVLLRGLLLADDTRVLLEAVEAMGARVARLFASDWSIDGRPLRDDARDVSVNLGDGGAPTRFALALAAMRRGTTVIDGSARMRERPIADGIALLRAIGVKVEALESEGRLPLRVWGRCCDAPGGPGGVGSGDLERRVDPMELAVGRTASSQFVTAMMLIAPAIPGGLVLRFDAPPTSASYLGLTIESLKTFGAEVAGRAESAGDRLHVGPMRERPGAIDIAPDASSAVVWAAAAALVPGSRIELEGVVKDAQPDVRAIEAIGAMGVSLEWRSDALVVGHPEGRGAALLRGIDVDAGSWPDGALAAAAAATGAVTPTRLRSLGTLRVKESDRLAAITGEFRRLGVAARVDGDDLVIEPMAPAPARAPGEGASSVTVNPHDDHRIAMSAALVALSRRGARLANPGCVAKSYPAFWRDLGLLTGATRAMV